MSPGFGQVTPAVRGGLVDFAQSAKGCLIAMALYDTKLVGN